MKTTFIAIVCLSSAASLLACEKKGAANPTPRRAAPTALEGQAQRPAAPGAPKQAPLFDASAGVVGALRLGMSRVEAQQVMPLSADPSGHLGDNVAVSGLHRLVFDAKNTLASIEYNLTQSAAGVRIGATTLAPTSDRAALASALGDCAKAVAGEGGEQTACAGGRVALKVGRSCAKKDPRGACAEWSDQARDVSLQLFATPMGEARAPVSRAQCEAALGHVFELTKSADAAAAAKLRQKLDAKLAECEREANSVELACVLAAKSAQGLEACHALRSRR